MVLPVVKQLTSTPDGEFSPTVTPDGKTFSVIRQAAADGTQLLVKYDLATGAHHNFFFARELHHVHEFIDNESGSGTNSIYRIQKIARVK